MSKIALIFGGSRGIGRAVAKTFFEFGYDIVLTSRNAHNINEAKQVLRNTVGTLKGKKVTVTGIQCDVTVEDDVKKVFAKVEDLFCISPDVVINSAGINVDSLLARATKEQMEETFSTNVIGSMLTSKYAVRHMMQCRKGGSIVCIGSVVGQKGAKGQSMYSASKAALVGLTKSVAREVASRNIRVNLIEPGFILTDMTSNSLTIGKIPVPLGRFGRAEEVAEAVHFLCTSRYITGQVLTVDGGLQLCS